MFFGYSVRSPHPPPPSQAGVGFGLWLGSPVWFCRSMGRHEIKLRRKQGPASWGVLGRWHGAPLSCRDVRRDVRREVQPLKHHGQRAIGARFAVAPNMATAAVSVEHIDEVRRDHICPEESTQLRQLAQFADPASACSPSRALASLTPPRAWVRQYPGLQRLQAGIAGNFLAPCG